MCKRKYRMNRAKEKQLKERRKRRKRRIDTDNSSHSCFQFRLSPSSSRIFVSPAFLFFFFALFLSLQLPSSLTSRSLFFYLTSSLSLPLPPSSLSRSLSPPSLLSFSFILLSSLLFTSHFISRFLLLYSQFFVLYQVVAWNAGVLRPLQANVQPMSPASIILRRSFARAPQGSVKLTGNTRLKEIPVERNISHSFLSVLLQ